MAMATYSWRFCNKREDYHQFWTHITVREPSHAPIWILIVKLSPQILALNGIEVSTLPLQWQPIFEGAVISMRIATSFGPTSLLENLLVPQFGFGLLYLVPKF